MVVWLERGRDRSFRYASDALPDIFCGRIEPIGGQSFGACLAGDVLQNLPGGAFGRIKATRCCIARAIFGGFAGLAHELVFEFAAR